MTFAQLCEKLGPQSKADWRTHPNGGGWLNKSATAEPSAYVGPDAIVFGCVGGKARVGGNAYVGGNARVEGDACVGGGEWKQSPLFIIGTEHSLTNAKPGHIQIGCKCDPFEWWLTDEAKTFAKENGYSDEQLAEYEAYVRLFMAVGK